MLFTVEENGKHNLYNRDDLLNYDGGFDGSSANRNDHFEDHLDRWCLCSKVSHQRRR